jgi:hypothetical protein
MKLKASIDTKPEVQDDNQRLEELDDCLKERMFSSEVSVICHSTSTDLHHVHKSIMRRLECLFFEIENGLQMGLI